MWFPNKVPVLAGVESYIDFIHDVLISLHENLGELNERKNFADAEELAHIDGKIQAYQEMISILRMSAEAAGLSRDETGL